MTRGLIGLVVLASLGGCRTPSRLPIAPVAGDLARESEADPLFATGRCEDAIVAYSHALRSAQAPEHIARLRLFRALARLDCSASQSTQQAFIELRAVERDYPKLVWGRIAQVFVDEVVREQALQQTLARTEAQVVHLTARIASLERDVAAGQADASEQKTAIAALRAERRKLQSTLEQETEKANALRDRVQELESELAGLKRIDMAREP